MTFRELQFCGNRNISVWFLIRNTDYIIYFLINVSFSAERLSV